MKTALQIIVLIFTVLYLFAALNQRRPEKQRFFLIAAVILAAIETVTITVF